VKLKPIRLRTRAPISLITIFTGGARLIQEAVQVKLGRNGTARGCEGCCKAIIVWRV